MPTIRQLPDDLASQIAAGEVVERPASIVKELMENALDAEATRVEVSVLGGGLKELSVVDDGVGMAPDDALLCLSRHATSKLSSFTDLEQLRTYGFRGEAIPSIASVSRFTLTTRTREREAATSVNVLFGNVEGTEDLGAPPGSQIAVRDLFANVPARLKFLRSTNTEASHVTEVFTQVALARPSVAFVLSRDGRQVRHFPRVKTRKARAEQIFENQELLPVGGSRGPLELEAYLSPPGVSRQGTLGLRLLVNGRAVRDRALSGAVAHAYGDGLGPGRYPTGVVYLDLPPALVDINVHPQKLEVRFADPRAVAEAVHSLVGRSLGRTHEPEVKAVSRARFKAETGPSHDALTSSVSRSLPKEATRAPLPYGKTAPFPASEPLAPAEKRDSVPERDERAAALEVAEPTPSTTRLRFLAQLQKTYLLAEGPDGIYVVDQHMVASRSLAQRLRKACEDGTIRAQTLLFPVTILLTPAGVDSLVQAAEPLLRFGLDVRPRAPDVISLHSIPELLKHADPEQLMRWVAEELSSARNPSEGMPAVILRLADAFCLKAGETVSAFSAQGLLNSIEDNSPEGRRTDRRILLRIGFDELARKLGGA